MKDKWKVFIYGVNDRGKEVRQTLINLGGKVLHDNDYYDYGAPDNLFFINHDGEIRYATETSEIGKIIMDNYREIKLPELWKDGDILVDNDNPTKFLVKSNAWTGPWENHFKAHLLVNPTSIGESPIAIFCNADYHKAGSEELRQFHEFLHKHGKDWDAEKKQLVKWKWKPKEGDDYWTVTADTANKIKLTWFGTKVDEARYKLGNCFKTIEEAEAMSEKVKNLFLQNYEETKENL